LCKCAQKCPPFFQPERGLEKGCEIGNSCPVSTVKQIESALASLPVEDLQAVRDWLDDFIEDQLEVSDEFKAKIQRANQEQLSGNQLKPFTAAECRLAYRTPNPEFDALEHHCASLPKRQPEQ
jgi:hypothetical protein